MRVISGSAKSLRLKTIEGDNTRPTTDRIKETLFNMINNDMYGCRFLDLFSGSGGIGIEALSRGAKECYFVENNKKAVNCIEENLKFTKLNGNARVMNMTAQVAVKTLYNNKNVFDYIFMDPPYNKLLEKEILELIVEFPIIDENSVIIVEASKQTETDYITELGYNIVKEKIYKTNKHIFVQKK